MPVTIGSKLESSFSHPIGLLSECHRRIERFLAGLLIIAEESRGSTIPEEHREQFEIGLRYFREAAPKHTLDEEESLFPRLRAHKNADESLAMLDKLHLDHLQADDAHRVVDRLGTTWIAQGNLSPSDSDLLIAHLKDLQSTYEQHIALEDRELFPLAERLLTSGEREVIAQEMAARRGLRTGAIGSRQ